MVVQFVSVLWTVLVCVLVFGGLRLFQRWQKIRKLVAVLHQFPTKDKHWLLGSLYRFPGPNDAGLQWTRESTAEFPTSMAFWYGPVHGEVWLRHPDSLKPIFQSSEPKPLSFAYAFALPWLGEGLLLSQGAKWSRNRRLLTPAFHFDVLKPYMAVYNQCGDVFVEVLQNKIRSGTLTLDIHERISRYTFDVMLRCIMSYETDVQTMRDQHPYLQSVATLCNLMVDRILKPWLFSDVVYWFSPSGRALRRHCQYVHDISANVIRTRQQTLAVGGCCPDKRYKDFLDVILQARDEQGEGLTFREIRDEVDTFLFEGHDTTASALTWTLYSLAEHGHFQTQCQQEIDSVLADRHTDDITWDDLSKLPFLTQCLKEALRLHSPVPFVGRQLSKEMLIDGRTLPKDTFIGINIYNLHHNPQVWPDSLEFRPSRFDPSNSSKMDSFAFAPFSAGPRNCIGQNFAMHEMKTILARILRRFKLSLDPDSKPEKEISLVIRPKNGVRLRVEARDV